jgi:hypothetical protein
MPNESGFFEAPALFQRFDFISAVEEAMAGLPHKPKILSWIVFKDQREMDLILHVLLDRLDDCDLAIECHVHDVSTLFHTCDVSRRSSDLRNLLKNCRDWNELAPRGLDANSINY